MFVLRVGGPASGYIVNTQALKLRKIEVEIGLCKHFFFLKGNSIRRVKNTEMTLCLNGIHFPMVSLYANGHQRELLGH